MTGSIARGNDGSSSGDSTANAAAIISLGSDFTLLYSS